MKRGTKETTSSTGRMKEVAARRKDEVKPNRKEVGLFRRSLLARRDALLGDFSRLQDEALGKSRQDATGDLSSMPIHLADQGSDTFEQDFALGLIEGEEQELRSINAALQKIADGTFGLCEICSAPIGKNRLKALPSARLCIECKKLEEGESS